MMVKLLGISDLAKRWNYTKQGVHGKIKNTPDFPKPVGIINQKVKVFLEDDIVVFEKDRNELHNETDKRRFTLSGGKTLFR